MRGDGRVHPNKAQSSGWSGQVVEEGRRRKEIHLPSVHQGNRRSLSKWLKVQKVAVSELLCTYESQVSTSVKWKPPKRPNLAGGTVGKAPALISGWRFR